MTTFVICNSYKLNAIVMARLHSAHMLKRSSSWLLLVALFCNAMEANAWGLYAHVAYTHYVLAQVALMPLIPITFIQVMQRYPQIVMAGACLPDLAVVSKPLSHSHGWGIAQQLIQAKDAHSVALGIGYNIHLLADVVAHQHFVPSFEAKWQSDSLLTHAKAEWAMDAHIARQYRESAHIARRYRASAHIARQYRKSAHIARQYTESAHIAGQFEKSAYAARPFEQPAHPAERRHPHAQSQEQAMQLPSLKDARLPSPAQLLRAHQTMIAHALASPFGVTPKVIDRAVRHLAIADSALRFSRIPSMLYARYRAKDNEFVTKLDYYQSQVQLTLFDLPQVLSGAFPAMHAEHIHLSLAQLSAWRHKCLQDARLRPTRAIGLFEHYHHQWQNRPDC